jgi:signal transduction histidine kinase
MRRVIPPRPGTDAISAVELLVDVLSGIETDEDGEGFYSHLAEAVCDVAGMRRALVFRYDAPSRRVRAVGAHGISLEPFVDVHVGLETAPVAAQALAEDRVIEVRPPEPHLVDSAFAELLGDHPLIYVPMAASGRMPGVILAEPLPEHSPLDDERRDLLWTLGKVLALASSARIATFQSERAKQLEERIDLARDIHERVVQRLFGVSLALSSDGPLDGTARERAAEEVQTALVDLRAALQRPLGRTPRETGTTLAAEVQRLAAEHPPLTITVDGEVPAVPEGLEALAQSIFAEAVRNATKHADATSIVVRVRREDGLFVLEVANDGVNKRRATGPPGVGLRLAALEALHVGGLVEFGARDGGTWQVRLAVPEESA